MSYADSLSGPTVLAKAPGYVTRVHHGIEPYSNTPNLLGRYRVTLYTNEAGELLDAEMHHNRAGRYGQGRAISASLWARLQRIAMNHARWEADKDQRHVDAILADPMA